MRAFNWRWLPALEAQGGSSRTEMRSAGAQGLRQRALAHLQRQEVAIADLKRRVGAQKELIATQQEEMRALNRSLRDYQLADTQQVRLSWACTSLWIGALPPVPTAACRGARGAVPRVLLVSRSTASTPRRPTARSTSCARSPTRWGCGAQRRHRLCCGWPPAAGRPPRANATHALTRGRRCARWR